MKRIKFLLSIIGVLAIGLPLAFAVSVLGRMELQWPDLDDTNYIGIVQSTIEEISDNVSSRIYENSVSENTTTTHRHNLGLISADLFVELYSGTGTSKTLIEDPAAEGWTISDNLTNPKQEIDVTTPAAVATYDYTLIVVWGGSGSSEVSAVKDGVANAPLLQYQTFNFVDDGGSQELAPVSDPKEIDGVVLSAAASANDPVQYVLLGESFKHDSLSGSIGEIYLQADGTVNLANTYLFKNATTLLGTIFDTNKVKLVDKSLIDLLNKERRATLADVLPANSVVKWDDLGNFTLESALEPLPTILEEHNEASDFLGNFGNGDYDSGIRAWLSRTHNHVIKNTKTGSQYDGMTLDNFKPTTVNTYVPPNVSGFTNSRNRHWQINDTEFCNCATYDNLGSLEMRFQKVTLTGINTWTVDFESTNAFATAPPVTFNQDMYMCGYDRSNDQCIATLVDTANKWHSVAYDYNTNTFSNWVSSSISTTDEVHDMVSFESIDRGIIFTKSTVGGQYANLYSLVGNTLTLLEEKVYEASVGCDSSNGRADNRAAARDFLITCTISNTDYNGYAGSIDVGLNTMTISSPILIYSDVDDQDTNQMWSPVYDSRQNIYLAMYQKESPPNNDYFWRILTHDGVSSFTLGTENLATTNSACGTFGGRYSFKDLSEIKSVFACANNNFDTDHFVFSTDQVFLNEDFIGITTEQGGIGDEVKFILKGDDFNHSFAATQGSIYLQDDGTADTAETDIVLGGIIKEGIARLNNFHLSQEVKNVYFFRNPNIYTNTQVFNQDIPVGLPPGTYKLTFGSQLYDRATSGSFVYTGLSCNSECSLSMGFTGSPRCGQAAGNGSSASSLGFMSCVIYFTLSAPSATQPAFEYRATGDPNTRMLYPWAVFEKIDYTLTGDPTEAN